MVRRLTLFTAILCLYASMQCVAQNLAPVIRLTTDEATRARQLVHDLKDANDRCAKAKAAWEKFRQNYQAAHPDVPDLRFTADFRLAFGLLNSSAPEVRQVATIELVPEERRELETLHRELIDSEQSQKEAEKNWRDYKTQLIVDHVGISTTGPGGYLMLAGKQVLIPSPWASGLAFTSDFRLAFPQLTPP